MLSVIPAGLFSRLRIFLGRLKPHALPVARRHIVLGSIGAGTGLAVTSMFSHWLLGEVNLWFIAPMGASAVLLFGVPSSPLAQPWSIVGGNVLSALIGVTVGMLVPDPTRRWPAGWRRRWPSPECIFCAACILPAARWP